MNQIVCGVIEMMQNKERDMYKRTIITVLFAVLLFAGNLGAAMDDKAIDELIARIKKAVDPDGVMSKIKTQATKSEISIPAQNLKVNSIILYKFPYKSKNLTEIPGVMMSVRVYNGKEGWEFSPAAGIRDIKGKELAIMRLELDMKNPVRKMREIFAKIDVPDELEKVGEFECYKFICTPKKEYESKPVTLYFDKEKLFLRRMDMVLESQMGPIQTVSIFSDYKKLGGVWGATEATMTEMGTVMKIKVLDFKTNVYLPESEFEKPALDMQGTGGVAQ